MLITNYNLGPVGFGRSVSPFPGLTRPSADVFFVSRALSSEEHEVAVRLSIAISPSVKIDFFIGSNFSNGVK